MYNRYINNDFADFFAPVEGAEPPDPPPVEYADVEPEPQAREGLLGGLMSHIKLPEFDAETIVLLVLVWFLVAEEGESISDTLLIVGVLLLMGF